VTLAEHPRPKEGKDREKAKNTKKKRKKTRAHDEETENSRDREKTNEHQAGFKKLTTILSKIIRTTQNVIFHYENSLF